MELSRIYPTPPSVELPESDLKYDEIKMEERVELCSTGWDNYVVSESVSVCVCVCACVCCVSVCLCVCVCVCVCVCMCTCMRACMFEGTCMRVCMCLYYMYVYMCAC